MKTIETKTISELTTINELVDLAYAAIKKAESIADETGQGFSFSLGYGMGGDYNPKRKRTLTKSEALNILESGKEITEEERKEIIEAINKNTITSDDWYDSSYDDVGWNSSSSYC